MTLHIALWGAVLATLTFLWNILKWREERPRIFATVEAIESLLTENSFAGISLTLRNRGGKKTTIESIFLYRRQGWFEFGLAGVLDRICRRVPLKFNVSVANPKTVELPKVLDVNESWERFIPLEASGEESEEVRRQIDHNRAIMKVLQAGGLRYAIQCSHTSRKLRGLVQQESQWCNE